MRKERREDKSGTCNAKRHWQKSPRDAPGATTEVADDDDGSSKALSDEDDDDDGGGGGGDDGEASWDEEEVSEGEVNEDNDARGEDCSSDEDEDEPEDKPFRKKVKTKK